MELPAADPVDSGAEDPVDGAAEDRTEEAEEEVDLVVVDRGGAVVTLGFGEWTTPLVACRRLLDPHTSCRP